jgi:hypothetical protein
MTREILYEYIRQSQRACLLLHYVAFIYKIFQPHRLAGSIPDGIIGIFHYYNPSGRIMVLVSTRPPTELVPWIFPGELTLILLMWRIVWAPNSIPIYIQKDATLHSLFISGNCSTCFGWYFHPSSGAPTTVFTASGIFSHRFQCAVGGVRHPQHTQTSSLAHLWLEFSCRKTLQIVTL